MGSRLRTNPDKILECFLEVLPASTDSNEGASIKFIQPLDFEDKEALKAIPGFCFPCISKTEGVQNYTFVLTDIQGQYRFGFCRYSPNVKSCLCILSYLPWFEIFYDLLNKISDLIRSSTDEHNTQVVSLLNAFVKEPLPKPGTPFTITAPGTTKQYTYTSPDPMKLPTIPANRNLTDYYAAVEPQNMITMFISMFFERRIIITSKKLNVLTACCYGAMSLLYPMHWQHMFVPIVPPHLLDYCCAPMPFLVGVHSSLMAQVRRMPLDEVVILDADTNLLECPFDDAAVLPQDVTHHMKSALKKTVIPIDDYVSKVFLSAMVSLVGGYRDALRFHLGQQIVFDREAFVMSRSTSMRPLLEQILQLQTFEQFITERLDLLNSGKGFNDVFEEQIGLQAENHNQMKNQYQKWLKEMKRSSGAFFGKAGKTAKKGYKETKKELKANFTFIKDNLAEARSNIRDKLKGKEDDEEIGSEIKKSNSLPHIKHYTLGSKISPVGRRRAISPGQSRKAKSFKVNLTDVKSVPRRPPPPRPNPYQTAARPRTCAMSIEIEESGSLGEVPHLEARHSAPNLLLDLEVAKEVEKTIAASSELSLNDSSKHPLVDLSETSLRSDDTLLDATSREPENEAKPPPPKPKPKHEKPAEDEKGELKTTPPRPVPPRRDSNSKKPRPDVPPRPSLGSRLSSEGSSSELKSANRDLATPNFCGDKPVNCSEGSLVVTADDVVSHANSPVVPFQLTPLRPVSLDLYKDTMDSLPIEVREFLTEKQNADGTGLESMPITCELPEKLADKLTNALPPRLHKSTNAVPDNSGNLVNVNNPFDALEIESRATLREDPAVRSTAGSGWVSFN